ncbi:TerD family protein [Streptomyces polyrhachis]|uniref:TerD family protein n=1 Tax=Streptomyces polyrhachis TaxID=1282885 RepID=A0ABW2GHI5_9ACTN
MSGFSKGHRRVDIKLSWDPAPLGAPAHDLDLVAAAYPAADPYGPPAYLVHFDSRAPDGTIILQRESRDGRGYGADEVLTLDLYRVSESYGRIVVGVAIQQPGARLPFGEVARPKALVLEGHTELARHDLAQLPDATAATIAEFTREGSGTWRLESLSRGYDADPVEFAQVMGAAREG